MRLREYSVAVTTTGSSGSATGSGTISVAEPGYIEYIYLNFHASAPATTDTTVKYAARARPFGETNILVVSNSATDGIFWPRAKAVDNANAAITDSHTRFPVDGDLTVSLAQSDALVGAVTAYVGVLS